MQRLLLCCLTFFISLPLLATDFSTRRDHVALIPYPRLAAIDFSGNLETTSQPVITSKWDLVVVGSSYAPNNYIDRVKARNPDILVGLYTVFNEARKTAVNQLSSERKDKLDEQSWWLLNQAGQPTSWNSKYDNWDINVTKWASVDSNGLSYPEWIAQLWDKYLFSKAPNVDIWFFDNVFKYPNVQRADWKLQGTDQSNQDSDIQKAYRQAQVVEVGSARKLAPNLLFVGNADSDLTAQEYKGMFDGAMMECLIGNNWSTMTNLGWNAVITRYKNTTNNVNAPHLMIFGTCLQSLTDYKTMRFALTTSLLGDAFFQVADSTSMYNVFPWYDEFDINLGLPIDDPFPAPKDNGVYMREFANGLVIVNPTASTQSVVVPQGYKHISGVQDASVNNGKPVGTKVDVAAEDGVILLKE